MQTAHETPRGRALPRDLPPNAPTPPLAAQWQRRLLAWGFAPLMVTGMVAGVAPGSAAQIAAVGAALMVALTTVLAIQGFRVRRTNQRRYDSAATSARAEGKMVRVVTTATGEFDYHVVDPPVVERLEWQSTVAAEDPGSR